MKLILLIVLLCGITTTPAHIVKSVSAKKACSRHAKAITVNAASNLYMLPSGLLFQF